MKTKQVLVEFEVETDINSETLETIVATLIKQKLNATKVVVRTYAK